MTTTRRTVLVLVGFTLLVVGIAVAYALAPLPNKGFRDAAAALAVITAAAVGIERVLEMGWSALGSFLGEWWPLSIVRDQVDELTDSLDPVVASFYTDANAALGLAAAAGKLTADELAAAQAELTAQKTALDATLTELRRLAPDSQRAQLLAVTVGQNVAFVEKKFASFSTDVQRAVNVANQSIAGVTDFLATFKENPGKRLISIWVGMLIGLAVAGFLGLDLFLAVLGPDSAVATPIAIAPDPVGIVMTGLVIGLGASPTHEVITVLQEIKKSRKNDNQPAIGTEGSVAA